MPTLLRDIRYGLRAAARTPAVSILAIVALALGIGANTLIFSIIDTVLLRGLPVPQADRLVTLVHQNRNHRFDNGSTAYADVCALRRELSALESIAGYQQASGNLVAGEEPDRVMFGRVNWNFFAMLHVAPALGRGFLEEEDRPGSGRVLLLTDDFWQRRFARDPNVVGQVVTLDGQPHTVVGVLPPRFRFTGQPNDVYTTLCLNEASRGRGAGVNAFARLKPGVKAAQFIPEFDAASARMAARTPEYKDWKLRTRELRDWISPDVKNSLWALFGAVGLVVLIACANVANLLLSRAAARRRELAVRVALGAGRGRLMRQLMAESAPIGILGGIAGLFLAWWGVQALRLFDLPRIPRLNETQIDAGALAFTAAVSLVTCVLFGLAPAFVFSRDAMYEALKEGGRGGASGARGSRMRAVLVVAEVSLALLLSVGASLMIRTFRNLAAQSPGFNPDGILSASIDLPRASQWTRETVVAWYAEVTRRVEALPGVKSVALTNSLPLGGNYFRGTFQVEGRELAPKEMPIFDVRAADAKYLRTMQIPMRRGRFFDDRDRIGTPPAVIISESTARRLFGREEAIGRRIGDPGDWMTIVGVTADVRHTDVSEKPQSEIYIPFAQRPALGMTVVLRLDPLIYPDPMRIAPLLRRAVAEVDRGQAVYRIASMERIMADRLGPRRLNMWMVTAFAGLALVLAAVGIYGLLSFAVAQRTHEIGIRMALGAEGGHVIKMVVRQALVLAVAGICVGTAAAFALTRLLQSILYGVSATDPFAVAEAAVLLAATAALAAYVPARRAAKVDPVVALRCE